MNPKEIRLIPIADGTVLDHLPVGTALKIVEILKLQPNNAITLAINTESKRLKKKDMLMMENRFLSKQEIEKIGLIAQDATLNEIKNHAVAKKQKISLPKEAIEVIKCINPNCITNIETTIPTRFSVSENPLKAKCHYCEKSLGENEIAKAIK